MHCKRATKGFKLLLGIDALATVVSRPALVFSFLITAPTWAPFAWCSTLSWALGVSE